VKWALDLLEQIGVVVEREPWAKTEVPRIHLERPLCRCCLRNRQPTAQRLIDYLSKRAAGTARFRLKPNFARAGRQVIGIAR